MKHWNRETHRWVKRCPDYPSMCQHPLHDKGVHCECGSLNWRGRCWHKTELSVKYHKGPQKGVPRKGQCSAVLQGSL